MGSSVRNFMILSWTEDLEQLIENEATVHASCSAGHSSDVLDLRALLSAYGPRFSLWNRDLPCSRPACVGRARFWAVRPGGSWKINLYDVPPGYVAHLHERWHADLPPDHRNSLPVVPMLRATGGQVSLRCVNCAHDLRLGADEAAAWSPDVTLAGLLARFKAQCGEPACVMEVDLTCVPREKAPRCS